MIASLRRAVPLVRWRQRIFRHAPADGAGVTLSHSRIYILPTRRGVALIATIATMLVTSLNYGLSLGFLATFLLTGVVGAALLHTFRNLSGLTVRPGSAGETFAGGRVQFTIAMLGGRRTRAAVTITPRDGSTHCVDVDAETLTSVTFDLDASVRGRVPLGRITIASDYPLGLWRGWAYAHFATAGIAYPAPERGAPPLPASAPGSEARAHVNADDTDLAGVREYQHGDPLQRVAWKAVARGAGWYTKAFDGSSGGGPVSLDFSQMGALDVEQRLSRLAAWVLTCERINRAFSLALPGTRIATGQGREHRRNVLTALAEFTQ
ncbi:MAG TPA: DUF58 domain-containing protein [Casimicrobiaceae bacterium]|nr:DUF58 domain-containing protein [Casimicrobiaceae bacterium]